MPGSSCRPQRKTRSYLHRSHVPQTCVSGATCGKMGPRHVAGGWACRPGQHSGPGDTTLKASRPPQPSASVSSCVKQENASTPGREQGEKGHHRLAPSGHYFSCSATLGPAAGPRLRGAETVIPSHPPVCPLASWASPTHWQAAPRACSASWTHPETPLTPAGPGCLGGSQCPRGPQEDPGVCTAPWMACSS